VVVVVIVLVIVVVVVLVVVIAVVIAEWTQSKRVQWKREKKKQSPGTMGP